MTTGPLALLTEPPDDGGDNLPDEDWVLRRLPRLDFYELWEREAGEDWIVFPLLPAQRQVSIYSKPKAGKSLLLLDIAASIATGGIVLGVQAARRRVLYVDFENDPMGDTRERLEDMGYGPEDLDDLVVLSFPSMAALDTSQGGRELAAAAVVYGCDVVVIDTVSRAVHGEENDNDTWLAFFRFTGLLLKRRGIALVRLDHEGKDATKGQRGGSAKSGDPDAIWRLDKRSESSLTLTCEASRFALPEMARAVSIRREARPLRHEADARPWQARVRAADEVISKADDAGLPQDAGYRAIAEATGCQQRVARDAARKRKERLS